MKTLLLLFFMQTANAGYENNVDGFYLKHFAKVKDNMPSNCSIFNGRIYRGGEPDLKSDKWIEKLKSEGIESVIDLRHEASGKDTERKTAEKNGIKYTIIPLSNIKNPRWLKDLLYQTVVNVKNFNDKTYIHCQRGEDRTGAFIALLRDCPQWKKEFKDFGGVLYPALYNIMHN